MQANGFSIHYPGADINVTLSTYCRPRVSARQLMRVLALNPRRGFPGSRALKDFPTVNLKTGAKALAGAGWRLSCSLCECSLADHAQRRRCQEIPDRSLDFLLIVEKAPSRDSL
jgi:hypothetical protein